MKTLGGSLFVYNGNKFDYCYKEAIDSLLALCDKVSIVDAGSDDGTAQDIEKHIEPHGDKVVYTRFTNEQWHAQEGCQKLCYFTNAAIDALDTDWVFNLQADEVIHEDSFVHIRNAMEGVFDTYRVRRLNLWKTPAYMLDVSQERKPCSTAVVRLAKMPSHALGDAESLAAPNLGIYKDDLDLIQIFHMGFVRDRKKQLKKMENMMVDIFHWEMDPRAKDCDELIPERFFSDDDIVPIPRPLPRFVQAWADERHPKPPQP